MKELLEEKLERLEKRLEEKGYIKFSESGDSDSENKKIKYCDNYYYKKNKKGKYICICLTSVYEEKEVAEDFEIIDVYIKNETDLMQDELQDLD